MSQERRLLKSQTLTLWKVVRENVTHKSRRMGVINVLESVSPVIKFRSNSELCGGWSECGVELNLATEKKD